MGTAVTSTAGPRRALIVSASIGAGHNAAGQALAEAAPRAWPGCEVGWLDALDAVGPGFAALARCFYVAQAQLTSVRCGLGSLFGRALAPHIRDFDPDVIVSTCPLGSAGLSWLRRHGRLPAPTGAWIPAFCPRPSCLYRDLDLTYVMHPAAQHVAQRAERDIRVAVGALPVRDAFAPGDQVAARGRLGVPADRFTAAVCTGSLGSGRVDGTVTALLAAGADVQVIVVCGRNNRLREQLSTQSGPGGRLHVLGWTDDMPAVMTAADVVVTNGGGTALEALTAVRPVIMTDPVARHGRANAQLMAAAGLAWLARDQAALTAAVRCLANDSAALARQASLVLATAAGRRREDDLADLAAVPRRDLSQP